MTLSLYLTMKWKVSWMTKEEAVKEMIEKIEAIERDRLSHNIEPSKQKQEAVTAILKALKGVQIDHAN